MASFLQILRRNFAAVSLAGGCAAGLWRMYQNTVAVPGRARENLYGKPEDPIDPNIQNLIDQVSVHFLKYCRAQDFASKTFYLANQPDLTILGSHNLWAGTHIGIPVSFLYTDESQVDLSDYKKTYADNPDIGVLLEKLSKAFVLSENAKKYALARTISETDKINLYIAYDILLGTFIWFNITAYFAAMFARKSNFFCITMFYLVGILSYMFIWSCEKLYSQYKVKRADIEAAEMYPEFIDGALEYFDKTMERNKVWRQLEPNGSNLFHPDGSRYEKFFEIGHVPLNLRRMSIAKLKEKQEKLKSQLEEQKNKEEKNMNIPVTEETVKPT